MPFKMMGKSPMSRKITGSTQAAKPGSSPAKIIPLLAGKAAALIGKKLVAKAATKAAAKGVAKAAIKKGAMGKGEGGLMNKAGKFLEANEGTIKKNMRSRMQGKPEEQEEYQRPGANVSGGNPYGAQNTAFKMKYTLSSPFTLKPNPLKGVQEDLEMNFLGKKEPMG